LIDNFPILSSNPKEYIPLDIIKPHEKQAILNHSQTLERLAERGGLSWAETLFVLKDEPYNYKIQLSEMSARTKVLEIIDILNMEV
jgi:biotin carboxylase